MNEIRVLFEVDHPSLIQLYEVYESQSSIYMVMELMSGGELLSNVSASDFYSERDAKTILKNILEGLVYLHAKNIVHRDLKPANIIRKSEKDQLHEIKIVDFGFATHCDVKEYIYGACGTPCFIPPELFDKNLKRMTPALDIFSTGIIFYILSIISCLMLTTF